MREIKINNNLEKKLERLKYMICIFTAVYVSSFIILISSVPDYLILSSIFVFLTGLVNILLIAYHEKIIIDYIADELEKYEKYI